MDKKTVYLFFGEDSFSSTQKLKVWKEQFIKKYGEDGIEIFEGKKIDASNFATNIEAVPFLSEKKLIVIKDFISRAKKEDIDKITKALDRTPDFCIVVFHENGSVDKRLGIYKKINKIGTVEEFKEKTPPEALAGIMKKTKMPPTIANYMVNHCGTNLWSINNELEKLKLLAGDYNKITTKMIDETTTPSLSASIFKLTDKITEKNTKEALKTFKTLHESGEELTKVFFMIVRHFRILIQVHDLIQKNEPRTSITKKMKQHPFVIQKTSQQSKNFTSKKLEEIYKNLLDVDQKFKTGQIKIQQGDNRAHSLAIEKLIINCCS